MKFEGEIITSRQNRTVVEVGKLTDRRARETAESFRFDGVKLLLEALKNGVIPQLILVKESFGNVLLSYLVDHYSVIYEIDYRYWKGDITEFAQEVGATDLLFANNITMICTGTSVGVLGSIIP